MNIKKKASPVLSIAGIVLASSLAAVIAGCASAPIPTAQMAVAEAAVKRANTVSTGESAPAELQLAKSKLANAQESMGRKEYTRAKWLAEQAEVDAQVAELHAQSVRSARAAKESVDAARVLNEEIDRKTTR